MKTSKVLYYKILIGIIAVLIIGSILGLFNVGLFNVLLSVFISSFTGSGIKLQCSTNSIKN